ncbi:MAG: metal ABC transporter solute-binding protein, Zn/Mn family, partial [Verrucomicrobiales bacterium]
PADVSKLNRSKVIFYNGLLLEGRMTDLFERLVKSGKPVYAVTDAIPAEQRLAPHGSEGHPDPHVWGDASLWALTVDEVVKGLSTSFPDKAAAFQERGLAYKQALGELHDWAKQRITTIPEGKRKLVTSHDAFSYFGRAYGVDVVGVAGISTASEASVADRTRMVDYIKQHQVAAIFVESSVNRTLIDRISKDANVNVGGLLYSDAMDEPGKMETIDGETYDLGTYSGMLKHNVNTVVEALK